MPKEKVQWSLWWKTLMGDGKYTLKKSEHKIKYSGIKIQLESHACSIAFCRFSSMSESILEFLEKTSISFCYCSYIISSNRTIMCGFQPLPGLAEAKRLELDFLLVYVYWEKTCHFLNRPIKFWRSLHARQIKKRQGQISKVKLSTINSCGLAWCSTPLQGSHSGKGFRIGCVNTYRFTRLGLEDRRTRHQSFSEVMVIIWTFKGISNERPAWCFWGDLWRNLDMVPHLSWQQRAKWAKIAAHFYWKKEYICLNSRLLWFSGAH